MFETEIWFLAKVVLGLDFSDHYDVCVKYENVRIREGHGGVALTFYADSEGAVFVVTGFVRDNVSDGEGDLGVLNPCTYADGAFMYVLGIISNFSEKLKAMKHVLDMSQLRDLYHDGSQDHSPKGTV